MNKVKNISKRRSVKINALLNGFKSLINLLFPLITFPYISRVLSVDGMGIYNFSYTYVGYFILIAGLGINTYAVREGSKYRENLQKIENFSSQVFSINIISTVISYLLLILSLLVFRNLQIYILCILIFSFQIFFTTLGAEWLYTIYEDYAYITVRSIIFKIISVILLFVFVKSKNDYLIYAGITVLATVGSNIFNYLHSKSFVHIKFTFKIDWGRHIKPILIIFASAIMVNIFAFSDTTILGLLKGEYAVGIYSVSVKFYSIADNMITAILIVTIPRLANLLGNKHMNQYYKLLSKLIDILNIVAIPAVVGLILMSKRIVIIVSGAKYSSSALSLQIMALAIIFSIFSWIFSDCVLIPEKKEKLLLRSTVITALFNISCNLLIIPYLSYNGAALTTVLSELLAMILNGYYGWPIIKEIINKARCTNIVETIIGVIGIVIICVLTNVTIKDNFLCVLVAIPFSMLIYFLILIFIRNEIVTKYFNGFILKLQSTIGRKG